MRCLAGVFTLLLAAGATGCGAAEAGQADSEMAVAPGYDGPLGKADASGADVELKVTLRSDQIGMARQKFGLKDKLAARREIWFYDTPELALFESGLILRGRDKHGEPDDSTVKLRPMSRDDVAGEWFALAGFKCEEDRSPAKSVSSCSLTALQDEGELEAIAAGEREVIKGFSSDQEALIDGYAGVVVDWEMLVPLGPVDARVWQVKPKSFGSTLTMELWELPDSSQLLEVSLRATQAKADAKLSALVEYLESRGFDSSEQQETKTRVALELFAGQP